ncbi:MAG: methionyl-tRNA formyltransferase [bacterium]
MRLLFMGTPNFACTTLKALIDSGFDMIGVFTQADRPKGRGLEMHPPPIKELAQTFHLPVFQPLTLKREAIGDLWSELKPDGVVVVAYGFILPSWILHSSPLGCINLHASLLPLYRGAAPINWAIIRGERETGVTTMLMDEGMDTGPILLQAKMPIMSEDTAASLHDRLSSLGAGLVVKTVEDYTKGMITPQDQPREGSSLAPKLDREIGRLDWNQENHTLFNLIRGINPYPGAYGFLKNRLIKIWYAIPIEGDARNAEPGMICDFDSGLGLIVQTGKGRIGLKDLQPESKKRMSARSFITGYRSNPIGSIFKRFPDQSNGS